MKQRNATLRLCFLGIMAAMIFVVNYLRIPFMGTSLHLTNGLCAMSGILLGPAGGFLSAGMGSMLFDVISGYDVAGCLITFVSKGAIGLVTGLIAFRAGHALRLGRRELLTVLAGTAAGALSYVALYMLKTFCFGLWVNGFTMEATLLNMGAKLPGSLINAVFACIVCPVLYAPLKPALQQAGLLSKAAPAGRDA